MSMADPAPENAAPAQDKPVPQLPELTPIVGGIPTLHPHGVEFDDLAKAALKPNLLPPLTGEGAELEHAISHRLRLASIPVDFLSSNPNIVTYQNYHRLGKLRVMIELNDYFGKTKTQLGRDCLLTRLTSLLQTFSHIS
jgi:hypothetical protein